MKLEVLAGRFGVARTYRTDRGERVTVARDTLVAVLDALGVDTSGRGWMARAAEAHGAAVADRLVEPVIVAWDGLLHAPVADSVTDVHLSLDDTDRAAPVARHDQRDSFVASRAPLPAGYHRLQVHAGSRQGDALVISAPRRAWQPPDVRRRGHRHWGVYAPLFALHRHDTAAPGDLRDLALLLEWVVSHGGDTILTLPLLASFLDDAPEVSPYSPISRLMWNELHVSLDGARDGDPTAGLIDYPAAAAATRTAIGCEIDALDADPMAAGDLMRFLAERPDVTDYARFRAAQARFGRNWRAFPPPMRDGTIDAADVDARAVRYHSVAQWLTDRQLGALGRSARDRDLLFGLDLAIGTHPDGYDVWRYQHEFATRANVGAPPDTFFVGGQDWGFPPMLPDAARRSGHDYFRRALTHHFRHATMLRVDHVMGLHRLYWVPHGAAPTEGTYVQYPTDELFAIVSLESHRARSLVVGEDLGTVPPAVRNAMRRHGFTGTWVAQGSLDEIPTRGSYTPPPRASLASVNTHDMPTFAGFLAGSDIEDRLALGQIDAGTAVAQHAERARVVDATRTRFDLGDGDGDAELHGRLVEDLGRSSAEIVLVNLEDLWLERRPHNVPGTSVERPNWRRPAAHPVDGLEAVAGIAATLDRLRAARSWSTDKRSG